MQNSITQSSNIQFSIEYRVKYYTQNVLKQNLQSFEISSDINPDEIFLTNIHKLNAFKNDNSTSQYWSETKYIDNIITYFSLLNDESFNSMNFYVLFGDSSEYADFYSGISIFSKVRPIGVNTRTILLKLQYERHFGMLNDISKMDIPYKQKENKLFWRGISTGCNFRHNLRNIAVEKFQLDVNSQIDIKFNHLVQGISGDYIIGDWCPIETQLKYKCLLSIEGNDVATNLKWIMMSNSVCIMPIPKICSWFMEDHLQPYVHFIPVLDDFSDLEEKYEWCLNHDSECEQISKNGTEFAKQFLDIEREDEITKQVIYSYF